VNCTLERRREDVWIDIDIGAESRAQSGDWRVESVPESGEHLSS